MIRKIEIETSDRSDRMAARLWVRYRESGVLPVSFESRIVFHMYPERDAIGPDGNIDGHDDTVLFRVVAFDDATGQRYGLSGRDGIAIAPGVRAHVTVFKDLSTRISVDGPVSVRWGQCVDIAPMVQ